MPCLQSPEELFRNQRGKLLMLPNGKSNGKSGGKTKRLCIALALIVPSLFFSCSKGTKKIVDMDTLIARSEAESEKKAAEKKATAEDSKKTDEASPSENLPGDAPVYDEINLDLTKQSSTVVYSQVFNMMLEPESFVGKKIRLNGIATALHDEEENKDYFACIVMDATACCAQGIEFELPPDMQNPEFYPKDGEEIVVTGVFEMYETHGFDAFRLANAVWTKAKA